MDEGARYGCRGKIGRLPGGLKIKTLAMTLAALLFPALAVAQEIPPKLDIPPKPGMVLDEGMWQAPTPAAALRALMTPEELVRRRRREPAVAVLRQIFEERPASELDAFADALVRVMLEGNVQQEMIAGGVLLSALEPGGNGTPYAGAVDALIRVYEALDEGFGPKARRILFDISLAGNVGYIADLFAAAEMPPVCEYPRQISIVGEPPPPPVDNPCPNEGVWCDAGLILLSTDYTFDREAVDDQCVRKWY